MKTYTEDEKEALRKREEIMEAFTIDKYGIIRDLGEFEGKMLYVPYFWDIVMDGGAEEEFEEDGTIISVVHVTSADKLAFPELEDTKTILLWETEQGFVEIEEQ